MNKPGVTLALLFLALGASRAKADNCGAVAGNRVTNCGFETGDFTGWSGTYVALANNNPGEAGVDSAPYPVGSGTYSAYLGSVGTDSTLSQTFGTVVGASYTISFVLDNEGPADIIHSYLNDFTASFGGTTLLSELDAVASPFTTFTYTTTATSTSSTLLFSARNDLSDFDLDSVSLVGPAPVPEPSSLLLLGTGAAGMAGVLRRRFMR